MTTVTPLRIGEVAERLGTTPRTIRYYEEIGLLGSPGATEREAGRHRTYEEADVERLSDALRFKQLLGLSLEELKALLEAEEARAALRTEWRSGLATGLSPARLEPFIHNMHTALWVLAATSVVGAFVSLLRPTARALREAEAVPA